MSELDKYFTKTTSKSTKSTKTYNNSSNDYGELNKYFTSSSSKKKKDEENTNVPFNNDYNNLLKAIEEEHVYAENRKQQRLIKEQNEQAQQYYETNKEDLKAKRTNNLIYNWNLQDSGGVNYNYGSVPIQNDKGYLKKKDKNGNEYWVDAKNDLLYDSKGKLINDDRLKNSDFINSLEYVYDENAKSNVNTSLLNNKDKIGLQTIDYSKYKFLIDNENNNIENNRKKWEQDYQKRNEYFNKSKPSQLQEKDFNYVNRHKDEGWIVKNGNYYKPVEEDRNYSGINDIVVNNKQYELVTDEKPRTYMDEQVIKNPYNNYVNVYETNFKKLNKAIEKGDLTTANNALQEINKKYFGHSYDDGWISALFDSNADDRGFFEKRFTDNVDKLNVINNSLQNTQDADLIEELEKQKNQLELENTLIQYNRLYSIHSDNNLIKKMDNIMDPVDEAWEKTGKLWKKTFSDWDDGYDFGDIFRSGKKIVNNSIQTVGTLGKQTTSGITAMETLAFSDMDDSEFKDVWLPAITDVATYMIPYVGQARILINYAEPGSVVGSFITQEGSATIDSKNGEPRVASGWNALGAGINIGANYLSDYIFKSMRGVRSGKAGSAATLQAERAWYENSAKRILTNMGWHGGAEAGEEFIQTFAEYMQNMEGDMSWDFFREHYNEAVKSATIALVTSAGASGISSTINDIKLGDTAGWYNANGDYIGPGAEKIGKNKKYANVKAYFDAVENGTENMLDSSYYKGAENIKINQDLSEPSNTTTYSVTNTKAFEDINYESTENNDVELQVDEDAAIQISNELQNDNIITILDSDAVKSDYAKNVNLDNASDTTKLSDIVINDNIKSVLVASKEMETYIKNLRDDLAVYTFDPKSDTFMDDVREFISTVGKSNFETKQAQDFNPNNYVFSPTEMDEINKMVTQAINKGNFTDSMVGKLNGTETLIKYNPITVSDITDSDMNTILNSIKTKFLEEIANNNVSKATAQKEFKELTNKLSDYATKSTKNRTYISDNKGSIITFAKRGSNMYEAVNTIPTRSADLEVFANVKTNGNIINGNLNQKVKFAKKQLNAVNTLINKLGLKGNYLTSDSTYKDIASLIKTNKEFSKEILQGLGADGLIEGKNRVRLYTAYDNLDNANPKGAINNTTKLINSQEFKNEVKKESETVAPKMVEKPIEQTNATIDGEKISTNKYAYNPNDTTELNNIEAEKFIDDIFKEIKLSNKKINVDANELKTSIRKILFDRYTHINDIAKKINDTNVRAALSDYAAVANDAQTMIKAGQFDSDGNTIGKSLDGIYSQLKGKKQKTDFERYMMLELNIERENAGVDKVFENLSKAGSRKAADILLKKNPKFAEIAKDLQRYNNNLLDLLVDGGVIEQSLSNKLKNRYKYYMPIYSSELSTFADLASNKYLKNMKVNDTIQDVTKTSKKVQTLQKSLENKTYNVLSAIAKNKLVNEMAMSGNYESDGKAEMLYYKDGKLNKMKTSTNIISDINDSTLQHLADKYSQIPVIKQLVQASNMSYRFILDPVYQIKNVVIDFTDSQLIYSKDKAHFAKNYKRAIMALANDSELLHEMKEIGLFDYGSGLTAPNIKYDENGNVKTSQNKFQRLYNNLENLPKMAEYISLKEKYMKEARADYEAGKYTNKKLINSKVKDTNGNLIKVYHGSEETFEKPNIEYSGQNTVVDDGIKRMSFTDNKKVANTYTYSNEGKKSPNANVIEGFLNIERPLIIDAKTNDFENIPNDLKITESNDSNIINDVINTDRIGTYAKQNGYDGVIINNVYDVGKDVDMYYLAFDPEKQEKAAKEKLGTTYIIFDNNQFITTEEYNKMSNNVSFKDIQEQIKLRAKVDAEDVNLNFNMGGTGSKALSKMGFKFLNAGMLGMDKFITHVGEGVKTPKGMGSLLLEFTAVGIGTALANQLLNGDDEDYDKLPYYYKNNYYMIKISDGKYFRIPKGRVQTLYNVLFEYGTGIRTEDDAKTYIESINNAFDLAVKPPALEQASPTAVWKQIFTNKDSFGNEIYSEKYDDAKEKYTKMGYHVLSNYFGRYGRIFKDITDDDSTTDLFNEFDYYKDTTKANRHYSTALRLVDYYQNKDNVKTTDDAAQKKYVDTVNAELKNINTEINQGKKAGQTTDDLKMKYAARDDLLKSMINNYKDFTTEVDEDGNTWYYFDDHAFVYTKVNHRDGTTSYQFKKKW